MDRYKFWWGTFRNSNKRTTDKKNKCDILATSPRSLKSTYRAIYSNNVCQRFHLAKIFTVGYKRLWRRFRRKKYSGDVNASLLPFFGGRNITFPYIFHRRRSLIASCSLEEITSCEMESITDEINRMSLCPNPNNSLLSPDADNIQDTNLLVHDLIQASQQNINPYKAIFVIDAEFTKIFKVNGIACGLLNYKPKDFRSKTLFHLMGKIPSNPVSALAEGYFNKETGSMVLLSGKVVEFIKSNGTSILTSLWIRQYNQNGPSVAFVEPSQKIMGQLVVNRLGLVSFADADSCLIFQCETDELLGLDIKQFIPSIVLPDSKDSHSNTRNLKRQKATGSTIDGSILPLCLSVTCQDKNQADSEEQFIIDITAYVNLSGLIIINAEGIIECICHHFVMYLFGYPQSKVVGCKITELLPNFCEDFEICDLSLKNYVVSSMENAEVGPESFDLFPLRKEFITGSDNAIPGNGDSDLSNSHLLKSSSVNNMNDEKNDKDNYTSENDVKPNLNIILKNTKCSDDLLTPINDTLTKVNDDLENNLNIQHSPVTPNIRIKELPEIPHLQLGLISYEDDDLSTPINESGLQICHSVESKEESISLTETSCDSPKIDCGTPDHKKNIHQVQSAHIVSSTPINSDIICEFFKEGKYKGSGKRADGKLIDVTYVVLKQTMALNRTVFCVWIASDHTNHLSQDLCTGASSNNSTVEHSLGQVIKRKAANNKSCTNSVSFASQCEEEQTKGEYNQNYTTLCQIGKGAFGCVRMAYRNSDKLLVVSKFILKDRVNDEFWIWDKVKEKEVPLEIKLLPTLSHPNIVSVYDIFENEKYFQLIMEKHGSGMDLFEFIDRVPKLDEPLISYIYRQIASAVDYLHSLHVLHRDIKDENIIINHKFEVKLIDFGSAAFYNENSEFSTFYGTTEYCSPEVLQGNKYSGPELEMWSMGVTLYVLTYSVNPFQDAEETLNIKLRLPHKVSEALEKLIVSLLCKDPIKRCTLPELLSTEWLLQPVDISKYDFAQVVQCDPHEANPDQYYSPGAMSGIVTPQETVLLSETNTVPTSFTQNDYLKLQVDSGENTEYYNDDWDESWDDDSLS